MSNEVVKITPSPKDLLNEKDIDTLKNSKFKGFTDKEIDYCVKVVRLLNLNPFLNQIHFVRRVDKNGIAQITTQIGIDGFRLCAQRAGGYAGSDEPIFAYHKDDLKEDSPLKATVTVYKMVGGQRCSFTGTARWEEYYPTEQKSQWMWNKMPHNQLAKCAEALALRKAFPAELSSVYCEDEMHQAHNGIHPEHPSLEEFPLVESTVYRVPGGQYVKRGLHEIDPKELAGYILRREEAIEKGKAKKPDWWDEFVREAEKHLGELENAPLEAEVF